MSICFPFSLSSREEDLTAGHAIVREQWHMQSVAQGHFDRLRTGFDELSPNGLVSSNGTLRLTKAVEPLDKPSST
ncbi:hypothetical protein ABIE13_002309 [Ottowia thiooxydans]|uniref:Uncharacterized protein n=1 Tax=Ottowia thiooxydans TaxID=219182 RepID=A0ABV2Q9E0_9BURK